MWISINSIILPSVQSREMALDCMKPCWRLRSRAGYAGAKNPNLFHRLTSLLRSITRSRRICQRHSCLPLCFIHSITNPGMWKQCVYQQDIQPAGYTGRGAKQRTILCLFESFCCRWQQFYGRIIKNSRLEGGT